MLGYDINNTSHKQKQQIETTMKHRLWKTRTYTIWRGIKKRCTLKSHPSFAWYGGKGIGFDPRWNKFNNFLEDMGEAPEGLQIDRIDTTKDYSKENCRWVDSKTNQNNRINNLMRNATEHSGKKFNKWTIIKEVVGDISKRYFGRKFECKCDCGTVKIVLSSHLKSGKSSQCRQCGNKQMYEKRQINTSNGRLI